MNEPSMDESEIFIDAVDRVCGELGEFNLVLLVLTSVDALSKRMEMSVSDTLELIAREMERAKGMIPDTSILNKTNLTVDDLLINLMEILMKFKIEKNTPNSSASTLFETGTPLDNLDYWDEFIEVIIEELVELNGFDIAVMPIDSVITITRIS